MPRLIRRESRTGIYHVFMRGVGQMDIFRDDDDHKNFMSILKEARQQERFSLIAYCLMTNHIHLLIRVKEPLSDSIKRVSVSYSRRFNKKYGRTGHLFQGRFGSEPVETGRYLTRLVRYIHMNPVKASMVEQPGDYTWSSYNSYMNEFNGVKTNLESDMIRAAFANWSAFGKYTMTEDAEAGEFMDIEASICTPEKIAAYLLREYPQLDLSAAGKEEKRKVLTEIRNHLGASSRMISEVTPMGRNTINRLLKEKG